MKWQPEHHGRLDAKYYAYEMTQLPLLFPIPSSVEVSSLQQVEAGRYYTSTTGEKASGIPRCGTEAVERCGHTLLAARGARGQSATNSRTPSSPSPGTRCVDIVSREGDVGPLDNVLTLDGGRKEVILGLIGADRCTACSKHNILLGRPTCIHNIWNFFNDKFGYNWIPLYTGGSAQDYIVLRACCWCMIIH